VPATEGAHAASGDHRVELMLMFVSSLLAVLGIGIAAFLYLKRPDVPGAVAARLSGVYQFLVNKGYVDELYDAGMVQPLKRFSEHVLWPADARIVDGAVNGTGTMVIETGAAVRSMQTGSMRAYAVSVLLGVVLIVGYYLWT